MFSHTVNGNEFSTEVLVTKVASEAGITDNQAQLAVESVKRYLVEKYPLLEGVVKNIFSSIKD